MSVNKQQKIIFSGANLQVLNSVKFFEELLLLGKMGWRLPSKEEMTRQNMPLLRSSKGIRITLYKDSEISKGVIVEDVDKTPTKEVVEDSEEDLEKLIEVAVEKGVMDKKGSWYKYEGDTVGQGEDNTVEWLQSNPDKLSEIKEKVASDTESDQGKQKQTRETE